MRQPGVHGAERFQRAHAGCFMLRLLLLTRVIRGEYCTLLVSWLGWLGTCNRHGMVVHLPRHWTCNRHGMVPVVTLP